MQTAHNRLFCLKKCAVIRQAQSFFVHEVVVHEFCCGEREREEMLDRARHSIQPLCDNETRGSSPSLLSLPERLRRGAFHRFLNSGSKQTLVFGVCCSLLLHYTLHDASVRHACRLKSLTPEEVARTGILAAQWDRTPACSHGTGPSFPDQLNLVPDVAPLPQDISALTRKELHQKLRQVNSFLTMIDGSKMWIVAF